MVDGRYVILFFFFSSRRRHTRCREVSWARRCVQETVSTQSTWDKYRRWKKNCPGPFIWPIAFFPPGHWLRNPAIRLKSPNFQGRWKVRSSVQYSVHGMPEPTFFLATPPHHRERSRAAGQ
eukprot:TRINITY_DN51877_c0_g1_i1.p3 TRINITY_DN51877_c0_g1~~TRINITY_DN51877_c0_g1_i1.p3  ORF type:complete len:121 (+),score=31.75 TRINITY_DN51877_c0_g1_i1:32-394(+)